MLADMRANEITKHAPKIVLLDEDNIIKEIKIVN